MSLFVHLTILGISFVILFASYYQSIFLEGGLYGLVEARLRIYEKSTEERGDELFFDGCVAKEKSNRLVLTHPPRFSNCSVQVFRGLEPEPLFVCDALRFYPGQDQGAILTHPPILGRASWQNMSLGDSSNGHSLAERKPRGERKVLSADRSGGARSRHRYRVIFRCPRAPWGWPRDATTFTLALKG